MGIGTRVWVAWTDGSDPEVEAAEALLTEAWALLEQKAERVTFEVVDNRAALARVLDQGVWCLGAFHVRFYRPRTRAPAEEGFSLQAEDACLAYGHRPVSLDARAWDEAAAQAAWRVLASLRWRRGGRARGKRARQTTRRWSEQAD